MPINHRNQNGGFETIVRLMKHYAAVDPSRSSRLPITSDSFLRSFVDASGMWRSLPFVRPAVNHFARWLGGNPEALLAADANTLEHFRTYLFSLPTRAGQVSSYRARSMANVARLLLYLQYQGIRPSYGWSGGDADLCIRFRDALMAGGLDHNNASAHALHGAHLIIWARLQSLERTAIDSRAIARFAEHPCCCGLLTRNERLTRGHLRMRRRAAVRLIRFAAGGNALLENESFVRATGLEKRQLTASATTYRDWLVQHRGLASSSITSYMNELVKWQAELGDDAESYTAVRVRSLARKHLKGRPPAGQSRFITVIRSYLRFRAGRGECSPAVADALISRITYSLGTVPRSLPFETLKMVAACCDQDRPAGIRDHAIMTLLLETGMRSIEVSRLRLSDIDWDRAEITVRGKGGQASVMPLPQASGNAILNWLEQARPVTEDDSVFVRLRRPHISLKHHGSVTNVVRSALVRAGLVGAGGAHLFRHGLARKLLKEGSGLPAISGVLRHQSLDTTMLYAKVDEKGLKGVARPWPGAGR